MSKVSIGIMTAVIGILAGSFAHAANHDFQDPFEIFPAAQKRAQQFMSDAVPAGVFSFHVSEAGNPCSNVGWIFSFNSAEKRANAEVRLVQKPFGPAWEVKCQYITDVSIHDGIRAGAGLAVSSLGSSMSFEEVKASALDQVEGSFQIQEIDITSPIYPGVMDHLIYRIAGIACGSQTVVYIDATARKVGNVRTDCR